MYPTPAANQARTKHVDGPGTQSPHFEKLPCQVFVVHFFGNEKRAVDLNVLFDCQAGPLLEHMRASQRLSGSPIVQKTMLSRIPTQSVRQSPQPITYCRPAAPRIASSESAPL